VPNAFAHRIIIPIPKGDSTRIYDRVEDYKGITVSSVISKMFQKFLLVKTNDFFKSFNRQFRFKKGVGCNNKN